MATVRFIVTFSAPPHAVYEALMDAKQHADFTGDVAKINRKVGGTFSVFGGYATGRNLKLVPDRKIVQEWRASDWAPGVYSTVTFELANRRRGTKLTFLQTDVPADQVESIKQGWEDYYWSSLKEYFLKNGWE
jgi:activator of HSP90 ATPase